MQKPIIVIAQDSVWKKARQSGKYVQSTVTSTLDEVGFIHCSNPNQTIDIANRHFRNFDNLILLVVDTDKVTAEVKFEKALSGRDGLFPHIYGALNTNAVINEIALKKNSHGMFIAPSQLLQLQ
jgi:uncharacterized protein (DUF952 family)